MKLTVLTTMTMLTIAAIVNAGDLNRPIEPILSDPLAAAYQDTDRGHRPTLIRSPRTND